MKIFIDESGSFVNALSKNSWNTVVAYICPESDTRKTREVLRKFKINLGHKYTDEVKLKNITEQQYLDLLVILNQLKGVVFCVATDSGLNSNNTIKSHQESQVQGILKNKEKMIHESGKDAIQNMADIVANLSSQLYVQLYCQTTLMYEIISRSITYFIQRTPKNLAHFCWKIDQKNSTKTDYEKAFEQLSPAFLQTRSFEEPLMMIKEFDYSSMLKYEFVEGEFPEYLEEAYGIQVGSGFNIGKIIREDIQFVDSKKDLGIQVADLLSAGFRRCLRGNFERNEEVAVLLGKLMVESPSPNYSVKILGFVEQPIIGQTCVTALKIINNNSKHMFKS